MDRKARLAAERLASAEAVAAASLAEEEAAEAAAAAAWAAAEEAAEEATRIEAAAAAESAAAAAAPLLGPAADSVEARRLRKKIGEILELRARADRGAGSAPLDVRQLAKVASEAALRRRLLELTGAAFSRGPAADSVLGERLIDVIGIVAAMGFACEVSHCLYLCGETWRKGDKGATNDMLVRSLELQCGLSAARAAKRDDFLRPGGGTISGTTQLMRATMLNNLPRVLQLVQLGAPPKLAVDETCGYSALLWACCMGHEAIAGALLDGKHKGRDVAVDSCGCTLLSIACESGRKGVVRLLLARGARQELEPSGGTALHRAVVGNQPSIVALLSTAPGFAAALALRHRYHGLTPLALATHHGYAACKAVLRAYGATE